MRGPRDCGALIPELITADLWQELKTGCFPLADGRSINPCESIAPTQSPLLQSGRRHAGDKPLSLTVTHIFLLWAKDLISLADPAALGGRARERTCSMKPVIGPRPSSGRPTLGMPDAPTVS